MARPDVVRQARIESTGIRDFRALNTLVKACFGRDAWTWLDVFEALTFPGTVRLKAIAGENIVGYVIGDRRSTQLGWIASIGVHPKARRQGLGRRLLMAAERALDTPRVRLTLRTSNQPAYRLYVALGYERVDVWKRYYRDGEDGLVMERVVRS
jgi:ribosomal protein S18 acetylase RimI-like enzyme